MNIDIANQGFTIKIQEMAVVPVRSVGIRLLHIAVMGLVFAIFIPFGLAYLIVMLDGKIRTKATLESAISVSVLGAVPVYINKIEKGIDKRGVVLLCMCVTCVLGAYIYVAWLRIFVQGN